MRFSHGPLKASLLLFVGLAFVGCGGSKGPARTEIFGKVTHNGQPIADGEILFKPDGATNATPSAATIKDGAYRLSGNAGLREGSYRVEFQAYKPAASKELSPGGLDRPQSVGIPNRDQILPEKFHKNSNEKLQVSGTAPVEKDYALTD